MVGDVDQRAPVTVVIPCFRDASTIERAVISAIEQTTRPAEVIVVDDFSEDASTQLALDRLRERFHDGLRIVALDANLGPSGARNRGWEESTMPFVAFLDADDAWHPQKLEVQLPRLLEEGSPRISGHRRRRATSMPSPLPASIPMSTRSTRHARRLLFKNSLPTSSVVVRRDLPFRFNPNRRYCEDYELWLKIALSDGRFDFVHAPLAFAFKASFGESGLSSHLREMEDAQVSIYRELLSDGQLNHLGFGVLWFWSKARYVRRFVLSTLRHGGRRG